MYWYVDDIKLIFRLEEATRVKDIVKRLWMMGGLKMKEKK